ncbi:MAG: hypothetical protein JSS27_00930 [Planctomycetes bacterium]|nr:hypothetical protein [Planctomycetota bacterium]
MCAAAGTARFSCQHRAANYILFIPPRDILIPKGGSAIITFIGYVLLLVLPGNSNAKPKSQQGTPAPTVAVESPSAGLPAAD